MYALFLIFPLIEFSEIGFSAYISHTKNWQPIFPKSFPGLHYGSPWERFIGQDVENKYRPRILEWQEELRLNPPSLSKSEMLLINEPTEDHCLSLDPFRR